MTRPTIPVRPKTDGALHRALRAATRNDHQLLDRMILRLDLGRRADYGLFLQVHHTAMQDLSRDWREEDLEDFSGMTRCLQNDLQVLGMSTAALVAPSRGGMTKDNRLGMAYVIRGSRLGAPFLRGRVLPTFSASYFDFVPAIGWTRFLEALRGISEDPGSAAAPEVIDGARITFQLFAGLLTQALA
jgi:heme oxygenase